ncbi:MAG: tRNA lysidine(34) synthetase TilS [Pseudorhodobacter sp.]
MAASSGQSAEQLRQALVATLGPETVTTLGVAVSGGGDSLALLHLLSDIAPGMGWRLAVATVDHGLRDGSADEARQVAEICKGLGLRHQVLCWHHGAVRGNLMEAARHARYGLLETWAQGEGLGHVALAHTADDQAETFLLGLGRAAGLDGLTGMRPVWSQGGVRFVRPLLGVSRADLRAFLVAQGQQWIDDPSNEDARFDRIKARRMLAVLAPLGIDTESVTASMAHLRAAQAALQEVTQQAAARIGQESAGMVVIDRQGLAALPEEIRRRVMIWAILRVSGADHAPRAASVARVLAAVAAGSDATLGGCRVRVRGDAVQVLREWRAVADEVAARGSLWDRRWRVEGPFLADMCVGPLGAEGLRLCPDWRETGLPRAALVVTPAVWRGGRLVSAPLAGLSNGFSARIAAPGNLFAVSH